MGTFHFNYELFIYFAADNYDDDNNNQINSRVQKVKNGSIALSILDSLKDSLYNFFLPLYYLAKVSHLFDIRWVYWNISF